VILRVANDKGCVELLDPERFDDLKLVTPPRLGVQAIAELLGHGATAEGGDHVRVPARTIARLAGPRPTDWHVRFHVMLHAVEPLGWDAAGDTVLVHAVDPDVIPSRSTT
jgi:hypothetical protein